MAREIRVSTRVVKPTAVTAMTADRRTNEPVDPVLTRLARACALASRTSMALMAALERRRGSSLEELELQSAAAQQTAALAALRKEVTAAGKYTSRLAAEAQEEERIRREMEARLQDAADRASAELLHAYDMTIEGWSRALDLRDKETEGHTQRVTEMTLRLARAMGISEAEIVHIRRGALLHDIGKMGIPDQILLKPDRLTDDEWTVMKRHPNYAYEMLSPIPFLRTALDIPLCHHERWDGAGYPHGLRGEEIPLSARIFAVADVWDALRSDRPYRKAWAPERVRDHIQELSGSHFDPKVVSLFLETYPARPATA